MMPFLDARISMHETGHVSYDSLRELRPAWPRTCLNTLDRSQIIMLFTKATGMVAAFLFFGTMMPVSAQHEESEKPRKPAEQHAQQPHQQQPQQHAQEPKQQV